MKKLLLILLAALPVTALADETDEYIAVRPLLSNAVVRIAGTSGGGSATNVFFTAGQNTTPRTSGGSNTFDVTGTITNNTTGNAATATTATSATTATYATGTGTNVGAVQRMSPIGGNNIYVDMVTTTPTHDQQIGVARDNTTTALWFNKGVNGVGSNSWGMPLALPGGLQTVGNAQWFNMTNAAFESFVGSGWYIGFGSNDSKFSTAFPSGYGFSAVQPFWSIVSANPWMTTCLAVRASNTNGGQGRVLAGYNGDNIPIYISQYGISLQDFGDAVAVGTDLHGGECYQGRPYGSTMLLLDEEKNFYICMNGRRTGDDYNGQIPYMVLDVMTSGKTNPIFRLPLQRANAWVPYSTNWIDAFSVNEQYGHGNIYSNFGVGGKLSVTNNILARNTAGAVISADAPGYSRLGFFYRSGQYPKITAGNGAPIIFTHTDVGGLDDAAPGSQVQTDRAVINSDGTAEFYYATRAASLTATNYLAMPTNYVAANFTPSAGFVKMVASNNVIYGVSMVRTQIMVDLR